MAFASHLRRLTLMAALLAFMEGSSACSVIWPSTANPTVAKLYVRDYVLNILPNLIAGLQDQTFENQEASLIRNTNAAGILYSPNYVFVAEPELLIITANNVDLPENQLVSEVTGYDAKGTPITQKVLRRPLFILEKATLTYNIPGYNISPVTLQLAMPIKSNEYRLKLPGCAQLQAVQAAFATDPSKVRPINGTLTVSCEITDLDPIAPQKSFLITRAVPLLYSYTPLVPTTASASPGTTGAPGSLAPSGIMPGSSIPSGSTPGPSSNPSSPSPSPSPTVSPSESPSPTPSASASTIASSSSSPTPSASASNIASGTPSPLVSCLLVYPCN